MFAKPSPLSPFPSFIPSTFAKDLPPNPPETVSTQQSVLLKTSKSIEIQPAEEPKKEPIVKLEPTSIPRHVKELSSPNSKNGLPSPSTKALADLMDELAIEQRRESIVKPNLSEKAAESVQLPILQKVDTFTKNIQRSPQLIRQFFTVNSTESGLSSQEQGNIIHFGIKLESKILDLMEQYNAFINQLGKIELC